MFICTWKVTSSKMCSVDQQQPTSPGRFLEMLNSRPTNSRVCTPITVPRDLYTLMYIKFEER